MYGHKKRRYSTAACAPLENFVCVANVRKVFDMGKFFGDYLLSSMKIIGIHNNIYDTMADAL